MDGREEKQEPFSPNMTTPGKAGHPPTEQNDSRGLGTNTSKAEHFGFQLTKDGDLS